MSEQADELRKEIQQLERFREIAEEELLSGIAEAKQKMDRAVRKGEFIDLGDLQMIVHDVRAVQTMLRGLAEFGRTLETFDAGVWILRGVLDDVASKGEQIIADAEAKQVDE